MNKLINDLKEDINKNYQNEEFKSKCNFSRIKIIEEIDREKEEEERKKKEEEERKRKEEEEKKKKEEEEEKKKEEEKKEEKKGSYEGAVYIPPKRPRSPPKIEEISLIPEIIIKYEYSQKLPMGDYIYEDKDNDIIFTKNNSISVDLDEYFEESFDILKKNNLIKEEKIEEKQEKEETREVEDEDEIEDNNLIDELFNEIEMEEKKEEEKKEEEKKEEEKKEEEKKEVKMEEEKDEKEKKEEEKNGEEVDKKE